MRSPRPQHTPHRLAILAPLALVAACKGQPIAIINVDNPSVAVGAIVALVGDKSTDPNGDPLTYRWSMGIPAGSLSTLQAADQSRAWFSPDLPGAYTIQLKVADPSGERGLTDRAQLRVQAAKRVQIVPPRLIENVAVRADRGLGRERRFDLLRLAHVAAEVVHRQHRLPVHAVQLVVEVRARRDACRLHDPFPARPEVVGRAAGIVDRACNSSDLHRLLQLRADRAAALLAAAQVARDG